MVIDYFTSNEWCFSGNDCYLLDSKDAELVGLLRGKTPREISEFDWFKIEGVFYRVFGKDALVLCLAMTILPEEIQKNSTVIQGVIESLARDCDLSGFDDRFASIWLGRPKDIYDIFIEWLIGMANRGDLGSDESIYIGRAFDLLTWIPNAG